MKVNVDTESMTDQKIVEVRTVREDSQANKLFSEGWILIHGGASHVDAQGFNAKPHFIMGRVEHEK